MAKQHASAVIQKRSESKAKTTAQAFEKALDARGGKPAEYILRLYVTGSSARSMKAIYNLKKLCEEYLPNEYELEVIDIYADPGMAREEQIIAAPTLVKLLPVPLRKFVGDLSNTEKLLVGLDIYARLDAKKHFKNT